MRSLSQLSARNLTERKGRYVLTAFGITFGVAMVSGSLMATATARDAFEASISALTGDTDLNITAVGGIGSSLDADEELLIEAQPGVHQATPIYGATATIVPGSAAAVSRIGARVGDTDPVVILGVKPQETVELFDYDIIAGVFASGNPGEVVISEKIAEEFVLGVGNAVSLLSPLRPSPTEASVVGIVAATGPALASAGRVAFMDIGDTQRLMGVTAKVSRFDVALADGFPPGEWAQVYGPALGPGHRFDVSEGGGLLARILPNLDASFGAISAIALFVGGMLIYLTFATAVAERTKLYGTIRALGGDRSQVVRLVVTEGLILAAISTVFGLVLGALLALAAATLLAIAFELDVTHLAVTPLSIVAGILTGMGVTLVATLLPARRAGRLSPITAMKGELEETHGPERGWIAGVALVAFGLLFYFFGPKGDLGLLIIGLFSILIGGVLVVPAVLGPIARVVGHVTGRLVQGVGRVGVMHLVKEQSRSAYTLGLLMTVLSALLSMAAINRSFSNSLVETIDRQFGADVTIAAFDPTFGDADAKFLRDYEADLLAYPGVAAVSTERLFTITGRRTEDPGQVLQIATRVIDPETYDDVSAFEWHALSDTEMKQRLRTGRVLALTDEFAAVNGIEAGDELLLDTATGPVAFTVATTYASLARFSIMGLPDAQNYFAVGDPVSYSIQSDGSVSADTLATLLVADVFAADPPELVRTAEELKTEIGSTIQGIFNLFYGVMIVAGIVGMLGLANTLIISVLQRTREIGVLRSIGTHRRQMLGMIIVESLTMTFVAVILAIPLGSVLSLMLVQNTGGAIGLPIEFSYPYEWPPILGLVGLVVAILAASAPARRAAAVEPVEAMRFD